ncbi:uncharacterized protein LY89DRAFT_127360 [Mollisia scopiformis]|uniref:Fungal N-terminal domain-containing protein n=1 Tax=Mollisia scopiformis TaxID=149040 RepID=A0A194X491_MOLSC|nr:uncharacterized protein LY89DRAFT_127360 [Mollisia scopiformis]KUJ14995.1 hypothetical protein LY89DRAFT_127360 [Mollisia scopiformis]
MSGLELITALGVAASVAQLIEYSLKVIKTISEINSRVKNASSCIAQCNKQIRQLIQVGQAIQGNENFHSDLIACQLQNTLAEVKHLHELLGQVWLDYTTGSSGKRIWKAVVGDKERHMLKSSERLEKEKTSLIICIGVFQSQTLQTIEAGVEILVDRDMPKVQDVLDKLKMSSKKSKAKKHRENVSAIMMPQNNQREQDQTCRSLVVRESVNPDPETGPNEHSGLYRPQLLQADGHSYSGANSNRAVQMNGETGTGLDTNNAYAKSLCENKGFQVNGNYGSSGFHTHKDPLAAKGAFQINGNLGPGVTREELNKWNASEGEGTQ